MKKLIALIIPILFLFTGFGASASADNPYNIGLDLDVFAADQEGSDGVKFAVTGGNDFIYRADVVGSNNLGGLSFAGGKKFGPVKVYLGASSVVKFDPLALDIDVNGVNVPTKTGEGRGDAVFVEARYGGVFARYSKYDVDHKYSAVRINSNYEIFSDSGVVSSAGYVLWLGYGFRLK